MYVIISTLHRVILIPTNGKRQKKRTVRERRWEGGSKKCSTPSSGVGVTKMLQNKPWMEAQDSFLQAWNVKPDRAEPLYELARIHRLNENPRLGYLFSKAALEIPFPEE